MFILQLRTLTNTRRVTHLAANELRLLTPKGERLHQPTIFRRAARPWAIPDQPRHKSACGAARNRSPYAQPSSPLNYPLLGWHVRFRRPGGGSGPPLRHTAIGHRRRPPAGANNTPRPGQPAANAPHRRDGASSAERCRDRALQAGSQEAVGRTASRAVTVADAVTPIVTVAAVWLTPPAGPTTNRQSTPVQCVGSHSSRCRGRPGGG